MSNQHIPQEAVAKPFQLTKREIEVMMLVIEGHPSKAVADCLFLSKRTVDFHLESIFKKLQVTNRLQACRRASQLGLLPAI